MESKGEGKHELSSNIESPEAQLWVVLVSNPDHKGLVQKFGQTSQKRNYQSNSTMPLISVILNNSCN